MANDLLRGRQTVAYLVNKSGGGVVAGDVVILGSATASSFITTTSAAQIADWVGVALETIADNASGRVCLFGYVPLVNLASSASLGDYIRTHSVAKQAQRFAATGAGDFGQVLGTGTTPPAIIWARPDQGAAGGGAPTTTPYVTTALDAGLSAEIVIPGLAASPDIAGAGGSNFAEEYDSGTTGLTWTPSDPTTVDSDTTVQSHLYIRATDSVERFGVQAWAPAGAFDVRAKVAIGTEVGGAGDTALGLHVQDATNANRALLLLSLTPSTRALTLAAYTYASATYTQRGSTQTLNVGMPEIYLSIRRDGSNNVAFWYSASGLPGTFNVIATQSFTFTVSHVGFRHYNTNAGSAPSTAIADWLRAS